MDSEIRTADQLLQAQHIGRCELLAGEFHKLIPPGAEHGRVTINLTIPLANHVKAHDLGTVFAAETGFILAREPDTVRAPDIAFVRSGRLAVPLRGYYPEAPDLAVEILSPDDRPGYVRDKVAEWLESGCRSVWVVDPRDKTVTVHERGREPEILVQGEILSGGRVLPGFELSTDEIFR